MLIFAWIQAANYVLVCEIDASKCSQYYNWGTLKTVNLANSLYKCQDIGFSLFFKVIRLLFA